jgi:hypothetical protein
MEKIRLIFTFFTAIFFLNFALPAQIKNVTYDLTYNDEDKTIDVYLVILEGETREDYVPDRIQFNSQISLVVPKGTAMSVVNTYNPLINNKDKNSDLPTQWVCRVPVLSPKAAPKSDFYNYQPNIIPTSFYNEMRKGDRVKIMTLSTGKKSYKKVRLFQNTIDPSSNTPGMLGRDLRNSFCLGGVKQLYTDVQKKEK